MRYFLTICWYIACVAAVAAQERANTLTPKESADGWISLFDGETLFGWKVDGEAKIENGILKLPHAKKEVVATFTTTFPFDSFEMYFESHDPFVGAAALGILEIGGWPSSQKLDVLGGGGPGVWIHHTLTKSTDEDKTIKMVSDSKGKGDVPGAERFKPPTQIRGFGTLGPHQIRFRSRGEMSLRNIKIRPLGTKSLFNGKDLTGWKEFPGKKSKFTVTDKGEINVKDGPGDLQSAGKYGDFFLQLDCLSNGKHLNSGLFFRCRPGEYQNGYEAQIRNQFTAEPTQEYTLEEYDPKEHKLIGKEKVKYTAVDYGTGAIYRRQPARKEVSRDGEWFTMTIVAHGNHFATWVNGVQVTDWTDNRPLSDNARTGFRSEAGPISIQGHDPTTDLSFRNFRLAESSPGK